MTKSVGCLGILLLLVTSAARADSIPTGQVVITSGNAFLIDANSAGFFISSSQFSAGSGTPDWTFQSVPTPNLIHTLPFQQSFPDCYIGDGICSYSYAQSPQGLTLSVTGEIPSYSSAGFTTTCISSHGSYIGVQAACVEGVISFTGQATVSQNSSGYYSAPGTFSATGELKGYGPTLCELGSSQCTELFDVSFTGAGIMSLSSFNNFYFSDLLLEFQPIQPTPEPSTALMFLGGILVLASLLLRKRLRVSACVRATRAG